MVSRLTWGVLLTGSIAVLVAVAYFFTHALALNRERQNLVSELRHIGDERGPCAGLVYLHKRPHARDSETDHIAAFWRQAFAQDIVGDKDLRGQSALLSADHDGLIDEPLCLQVQLAHNLGDDHPILAFLRFARQGGDPCHESQTLLPILAALTSHRDHMLAALMLDADRLRCLAAPIAARIAAMVAATAVARPMFFDQLDTLRIAGFLDRWAPEQAAQFACFMEATGQSSALAASIGCTNDSLTRVLTHYRFLGMGPSGSQASSDLAAGTEIVAVKEDHDQCSVRPLGQPPRLFTVPCATLTLVSEVTLAVLVEPIAYGQAKADLIAGVATYSGAQKKLSPSTSAPNSGSWFAYDRRGQPAGVTHLVDLRSLAAALGEDVPDAPLRTNCHRAGARFCYDVDWVETVESLRAEAEVYLSRPMHLFLTEAPGERDGQVSKIFAEAFGRVPQAGAVGRVYALGEDRWLAIEARPQGFEARWKLGAGLWHRQEFGSGERSESKSAARLIAPMDIDHDHRPDLLIQRLERQSIRNTAIDVRDEIVLLHLDKTGQRFVPVNRLVIREY